MTILSFTQIEIDGFRGLRSLNLEGLGRVNILVGQNNSGKTSVLEALSILCNPKRPSEWLMMVHRRDFGQLNENIVQSLRWCFKQTPTDYNALVEASCHFKYEGRFSNELTVKYTEFIGKDVEYRQIPSENIINSNLIPCRAAEIEHCLALFQEDERKSFFWEVNESGLQIENISGRRPFHFLEEPKRDISYEMLTPYSHQMNTLQLLSFSGQLFNNDVIELLKKFDADIEGIQTASFSGKRAAIYIKHKILGIVPLSVFGDATRRAVLLTTTLLSLKNGGVLLIDEVEAGIHVGALANVFKWLVDAARKLEIQLFVTTHSLEALDAIISASSEKNQDDIVVYQLSQKEEKTRSKRFAGNLLHSLRFDSGLDVR
jgi:predicted ATPase